MGHAKYLYLHIWLKRLIFNLTLPLLERSGVTRDCKRKTGCTLHCAGSQDKIQGNRVSTV
jgi:hypothetical protein